MKALVFNPTIPRFLATKALARVTRRAVWGPWAPLQLREVPDPPLPGADWVRVAVRLGGICGSDLHTIHLDTSPALSALTSFPFVLGHENVGTILEAGPDADGLYVGQRVTVEPTLPCAARGVPPCENCSAGRYNLCLRTSDGHVSPGLMVGACRDTGGRGQHGLGDWRRGHRPVCDCRTACARQWRPPCGVGQASFSR